MTDVRWKQRLSSFSRAFDNLNDALSITHPTRIERQGIVKAFELVYELSWKVLQDYLRYQGFEDIVGPKSVIAAAFEQGLIQNGLLWREMHQARNESAHVYNEDVAIQIESQIRTRFVHALETLALSMDRRSSSDKSGQGTG